MLATTDDGKVAILIDSEQPAAAQTTALFHEVLHLLSVAGGGSQDETAIDAMAERLALACPEVLEFCGLARKPQD